jgi:hypothetical protein
MFKGGISMVVDVVAFLGKEWLLKYCLIGVLEIRL